MKRKYLPLDAKISLVSKMIEDMAVYAKHGSGYVPRTQTFKFFSSEEDTNILRVARKAALDALDRPMVKNAFDTRRMNQDEERNPRQNLQYWHRSQPFIDEEDSQKITVFTRLAHIINKVRSDLGREPEWHESYARQLYDNVSRILRVKQADMDIAKPQLSYLEQLMYVRYRMTMADLQSMDDQAIRKAILEKDENLLKRAKFLEGSGGFNSFGDVQPVLQSQAVMAPAPQQIVIDSNRASTQEALISAIFGNTEFRKEGENTVERTITITIKDNVLSAKGSEKEEE